LTTEYPPVVYGGLGTSIGGLVRASVEAGIDVAVLVVGAGEMGGYGVTGAPGSLSSGASSRVGVHAIGWEDAPAYALTLARAWAPDIVHLHVFWLWEIARDLCERTGVPLAYTVHSLDLAEYEIGQGPPECLRQWAVQEAVIAHAAVVLAPSCSERDLVSRYCPRAIDRISVASHGIEELPPSRLRGSAWSTILFSGRFVDRKGIRDLFEAMPVVLRAVAEARFVLVGGQSGTTAESASHWLPEELKPFRDRIAFTGWLAHDELDEVYAESEILAFPSWYEPFGMVILEAMRQGLAIAAADVGGPHEILDHGRTALLFPPHDVDALAVTLIRLARDPELRARLGAAAREDVREKWLWPARIESYRSAYARATGV
jgi:glycogen(starch) synthase